MNDSSEPPRILVVDDTFAIHRDFEKILCPPSSNSLSLMRNAIFDDDVSDLLQPSFQVDFALQGEEGCDMTGRAVAEGRSYSVAFIDVRMPPGIDGITTVERLWGLCPELQVVICTALPDYSWESIVVRLRKRAQLMILTKPFAPIEVLQLACTLSEKRTLAQQAVDRLAETERTLGERTLELGKTNDRLDEEIARRKEAEQRLLRAQLKRA